GRTHAYVAVVQGFIHRYRRSRSIGPAQLCWLVAKLRTARLWHRSRDDRRRAISRACSVSRPVSECCLLLLARLGHRILFAQRRRWRHLWPASTNLHVAMRRIARARLG